MIAKAARRPEADAGAAGLLTACLILFGLGGDTLGLARTAAPLWVSLPVLAAPFWPLLAWVWPRSAPWLGLLSGLTLLALLPLAALSGPGAPFCLAYGLACLAGTMAQGNSRFRLPAMALAGGYGLWSLLAFGAVLLQVHQITQGAPWCMARHGMPPAQMQDLRGAALFTSATGYKDSSQWYFHGVLRTGDQLFIWSPRQLRFAPLPDPARQMADPRQACTF